MDIDPHAVGAARLGAAELASIRGLSAVVDDIVDLDRALPRAGGVDDVEQLLVRRKGEPVRPLHVTDSNRELAGRQVEAIGPVRQFRSRLVAEVIAANPGAVVAEPNRAVGLHDDIIGTGQLFAVERLGEDRDGAVVLGAGQPLRVHLAGHQPPLAVAGVAVGIMRRFAEDADCPGLFLPFHHPVVRDVAPDQATKIPEPNGALVEAASGGDHLYCRIAEDERCEARVEVLDVGVGIADDHGFLLCRLTEIASSLRSSQ